MNGNERSLSERGGRILGRWDAVSLLTVFSFLLFAIPAQLVVPGLGAPGRPSALVGLAALLVVLAAAVIPDEGFPQSRQPLRIVLFIFVAAAIASYVAAFTRVIPPVEVTAAERGLVVILSAVGIAALTSEGTTSIDRLETLLRRTVLMGTALGVLGVIQFYTGEDLITRMQIPGLVANSTIYAIAERSIFNRVSGTSSHAIEFGVVLASLLPLALHFAITRPEDGLIRRFLPVVAMGSALFMSVSRSAVLAAGAASLVLFLAWDRRTRIRAMIMGGAFLVALRLVIPGLLGTMRSLFTNLANDPSYQGRTADYDYVASFILDSPLFGRGIYSFFPDRYTVLDNQFLLTLVDMGVVGLVSLLLVFLVGLSLARGARRRSLDPRTRHLGQAIAASIVGLMVTFATFDALSFPQATGLLFLLVGAAGGLWRLTGGPSEHLPEPTLLVRIRRWIDAEPFGSFNRPVGALRDGTS